MDKNVTKKVSLNNKTLAAALYEKEVYEWENVEVFESFRISTGFDSISITADEAKKLAAFINKTLGV